MAEAGVDAGDEMTKTTPITELAELCDRALALASQDRRMMLGITGAPGAGKSTLAQAIVERIGDTARLVGMDGFHLAQSRLAELGRSDRKGAIDTFDGDGLLALLRRLRAGGEETVYAPVFCRDLDEPIASARVIEPGVRLIVVEGNYLLVPTSPWGQIRTLLDDAWYCERDETARIADLIARHRTYGKSDYESRRWALGSDQRNAELIAKTRSRADVVVNLDQKPAKSMARWSSHAG